MSLPYINYIVCILYIYGVYTIYIYYIYIIYIYIIVLYIIFIHYNIVCKYICILIAYNILFTWYCIYYIVYIKLWILYCIYSLYILNNILYIINYIYTAISRTWFKQKIVLFLVLWYMFHYQFQVDPRYQPSMFGCTGSFENGVRGIGSTEISVQPRPVKQWAFATCAHFLIHIICT